MKSNFIRLKNINPITFIIIIILLLNSLPDVSFSQSTWFWQQPVPTGNQLLAVKYVNPNTGFTAGSIGTMLKTTNKGANWFALNSGVNVDLYSLCFRNENTGYAGGVNGTILKTTNGGANWIGLNGGVGTLIRVIDFPSDNTGYAVGNSSIKLKTTN